MTQKPLGLLGGTFDPVHFGHLRLALESLEAIDMDKVFLIPLHTPPHREPAYAPPEHRLRMLQLATETSPRLDIADLEMARKGISYTIDTIRQFRERSGDRPLCLIMGMDAFVKLDSWKHWELIPGLVHIIVTDRPGNDNVIENVQLKKIYTERRTESTKDIHDTPAGRIFKITVPLLSISSTDIRQLIESGRSPEFLLPDKVLAYIRDQSIYRPVL